MKACGTMSLTPVLALIGLVGLGVGGYNWVSTGCPLGSCSPGAKVTTTAAATTEPGHCALCPAEGKAAVVAAALVSTEKADCSEAKDCAAEVKGGECCKGAAAACCQDEKVAEAKTECTEAAKSQCPMKAAEKPVETASKQPS